MYRRVIIRTLSQNDVIALPRRDEAYCTVIHANQPKQLLLVIRGTNLVYTLHIRLFMLPRQDCKHCTRPAFFPIYFVAGLWGFVVMFFFCDKICKNNSFIQRRQCIAWRMTHCYCRRANPVICVQKEQTKSSLTEHGWAVWNGTMKEQTSPSILW